MPGQEREQGADRQRGGQRHETLADAVGGQDADRVGAKPDEGRVAE